MKKQLKVNNFLKHNSPTILTVVGSAGVVTTAIMSARDTLKAHKRINYERGYQNKEFNAKEKIKIAAPCYIPTIISGISTILCICGANKLNKNVQKSLTGAYMLLDRSYKEYRQTVKDVYGEEGEKRIVKDIADRNMEHYYITNLNDTYTFFDFFSLRIFEAKISTIMEAEEAANEILKTHGYISLKDLYTLLGEAVDGYDEALGWSIKAGERYGYDRIEIETYQMHRDDGSIYYVFDFVNGPSEDYLL